MRNIYLIIKQEIRAVMGKRSFWIMTFLFPAAILLFNLGSQLLVQDTLNESDSLIPSVAEEEAPAPMGYVDEAGLVTALPPAVPSGMLQAYADETAAQQALEAGVIDKYFVIPADYLESGDLLLIDSQFQPLGNSNEDLMAYVVNYNLTGDAAIAGALVNPVAATQSHALAATEPNGAADSPLAFMVPFAVLFVFFFLITMSSGYMLRSVSREKENLTMEILLVSVRPRDLMLGKILGLSVVALFQMAVWLGGGMLLLERGRSLLDMASGFTFPAGFLLWALVYFLLGYLLYASLMGAIGALAPNAREAGQFTFVVLLPLMIPIWLNSALVNDPNSTLALALSLFPLTAPAAMMTRLVATSVPVWQLLASVAGLAVTTYALVVLASRFFRADTLLSTAAVNWKRVAAEWRAS